MDKYFYALTVIGRDKPGIVAAVSEVLYNKNISIEDSVSTLLGDQFTMTLIISSETNYGVLELKKSFAKARKELELSISLRRIEKEEAKTKEPENLYSVSVYGEDKVGIVYTISKAFADNNINILDLRTRLTSADNPMYVMILEIDLPKDISEDKFKEILNNASKQIGVDYSIRKIETYEL
ncbi:glycine cleavage system protein R [Hippea alviniae]|uniref:glycine cleavage system protein R n=1 Tax=Hippea alviniae TaxID=1279027 RepID=UPI0003B6AAAA|nr:ACT domain-containing protein [Hippea alviniae]